MANFINSLAYFPGLLAVFSRLGYKIYGWFGVLIFISSMVSAKAIESWTVYGKAFGVALGFYIFYRVMMAVARFLANYRS